MLQSAGLEMAIGLCAGVWVLVVEVKYRSTEVRCRWASETAHAGVCCGKGREGEPVCVCSSYV